MKSILTTFLALCVYSISFGQTNFVAVSVDFHGPAIFCSPTNIIPSSPEVTFIWADTNPPGTIVNTVSIQLNFTRLLLGGTTTFNGSGDSPVGSIVCLPGGELISLNAANYNVGGLNTLVISGLNISYDEYDTTGAAFVTLDITLPVELSEVFVSAEESENTLSWTTVQEVNNAGFQILHSTDGNTYDVIDFVEGAGTSDSVSSYSYTHTASNGANYYQLKQIDEDGTFTLSEVIQQTNTSTQELQISPNPASDIVSISLDNENTSSLTISDALGQVVYFSEDITSQQDIPVSNFTAGLYYVSALSADGSVTSEQIVIE